MIQTTTKWWLNSRFASSESDILRIHAATAQENIKKAKQSGLNVSSVTKQSNEVTSNEQPSTFLCRPLQNNNVKWPNVALYGESEHDD